MRAFSKTWAALLAVAAIAGCGGSEREDAKKVAARWFDALLAGDVDEACGLMDDRTAAGIRKRFLREAGPTGCPAVLRAYRAHVGVERLREISEAGLEAEPKDSRGNIGVFPVSGPAELQVILMGPDGDGWHVVGTSIAAPRDR